MHENFSGVNKRKYCLNCSIYEVQGSLQYTFCNNFYDVLSCTHRNTVGQWLKVLLVLITIDVVFYFFVQASQLLVSPISRRMANLSYVLWQVKTHVTLYQYLTF